MTFREWCSQKNWGRATIATVLIMFALDRSGWVSFISDIRVIFPDASLSSITWMVTPLLIIEFLLLLFIVVLLDWFKIDKSVCNDDAFDMGYRYQCESCNKNFKKEEDCSGHEIGCRK